MVPPMDQEAVEEAMDDTTDGSGSDRRNDGWFKRCKRWIRKKSCERWMVQAVDQKAAMEQEAVDGAIDCTTDGSGSNRRSKMGGTSDGSGRCRRSDGWYHRWIRIERAIDAITDGSGSTLMNNL